MLWEQCKIHKPLVRAYVCVSGNEPARSNGAVQVKVRSTLEILRELNVQLRIIRSGTFTSRSISKTLVFFSF